MRNLIQLNYYGAKHFKLPRVELLYNKPHCLYFAKLDLQNAYHSVILPESWRHMFVFRTDFCVDACSTWCWNRLGFGWDKSDFTFQRLILGVLETMELPSNAQDTVYCILDYLDDLLLASPDPVFLLHLAWCVVDALVKFGFLPSWPKCCLNPVLSIDWLGKHLSNSPKGVLHPGPCKHGGFLHFGCCSFGI